MFAAGFGTRMKALTRDRPKPLVEVAGRPLIDYALDLARDAGCDPIVANLHYKSEMLVQHLEPRGVKTVVESPDILETGGGLRNALPVLGSDPVMTVNTDAIWEGPNPLTFLSEAWDAEKMDALLILIPKENAKGHTGKRDFILTETGRIRRGDDFIYGGVQITKTDRLHEIEEVAFSLNRLWDQMLADERLFGLCYPGRWCDVGSPDGIPLAENLLEQSDV